MPELANVFKLLTPVLKVNQEETHTDRFNMVENIDCVSAKERREETSRSPAFSFPKVTNFHRSSKYKAGFSCSRNQDHIGSHYQLPEPKGICYMRQKDMDLD